MLRLVDVLLRNLDAAYDHESWHGPPLRSALRGVDAKSALWRPASGRHNIWEVTMHCAYWKYRMRKRLARSRSGFFPMKGNNWFIAPRRLAGKEWKEIVTLLEDHHRELRSTIESFSDRSIDKKRARLIYGIAAHDLYHAGQIQLLKRLQS